MLFASRGTTDHAKGWRGVRDSEGLLKIEVLRNRGNDLTEGFYGVKGSGSSERE